MISNLNPSPRSLLLGASAAALLALAFNACSEGGTEPLDPSLYIPRAVLLDSGEAAFGTCAGCHNANGVGSANFAPPLRHSDYFMAERLRPARILLMGLPNAIDTAVHITVNGLSYNGGNNQMPALATEEAWSNLKIAGMLTYIRALLNDSTSVSCDPGTLDQYEMAVCTKIARPAAANDSVAVWEIKALRDSLAGAGLLP
jgi:mono/diheme cytochrome c family protein